MEVDDARSFVELRRWQAGAFTRAQAARHGVTDKVLRRGVRARQLQRFHPGVYVDFTGPLPWETRVWAALLTCGPGAALTGQTALRAHGVDGHQRDDRIHVAVPHARRVDPKPGVVLSRHRDLSAILHSSRRPRTVRLEVALLLTASAQQDVSRRAAVLLDACRQRRTTPDRILAELPALPSLAGRSTLRRILADASDGVQSFLEHAYLRRVERAHGLPRPRRQVRATTEQGVVYRDTEYEPYGVIVELDGQAGHADSISRWRDMTRDNAAATSSKLTLRFGYQLVSEPCAVAAQVVAALHLRGWPGRPRRCSPACRL
ncbi:type IV toxin-antitoxin system AbiEi family antitoxin domain-containing protein [Kribbella sp. NPDC054772]